MMMKVVPPLSAERKVERSRCYPYRQRGSSARPNKGDFFNKLNCLLQEGTEHGLPRSYRKELRRSRPRFCPFYPSMCIHINKPSCKTIYFCHGGRHPYGCSYSPKKRRHQEERSSDRFLTEPCVCTRVRGSVSPSRPGPPHPLAGGSYRLNHRCHQLRRSGSPFEKWMLLLTFVYRGVKVLVAPFAWTVP